MNQQRVRELKSGKEINGPVIYWMSRDQRVHDNWALIYAQEKAIQKNQPLIVLFNLVPSFLNAGLRQFQFMIDGLKLIEMELRNYNISFDILKGHPEDTIPSYIKNKNASLLVTDFDPLKVKSEWKNKVLYRISVPFYEIDAHNIIPCWIASPKREFSAGTFRPKVHSKLGSFLEEFPSVIKMNEKAAEIKIDWENVYKSISVDTSVLPIDWIKPGESSALDVLELFIDKKLHKYTEERNFPDKDAQSNLSPFLHFGNISAQRVALNVIKCGVPPDQQNSFLEELIVRRELSDNYCYYTPDYDSFEAFPEWAQNTLNVHRKDNRKHIYTKEELEFAKTYDDLWNAAQLEMVNTGKMHGYMRMYWAKKILEWTKSPEEALDITIYLNDKYEVDGRDPNGYTGIAWSIGGVHDRAWSEREIFGKIRYMSYEGMKRKFNIGSYIRKYPGLAF